MNHDLQAKLRALREDPPDEGFASALHLRLAAAGAPRALSPLERLRAAIQVRPLLAGSAAGLLVAVMSFSAFVSSREPPAAPVSIALHQVPAEKVALLELAFTSEVELEDVEMSVSLDEGLAFWSDGEALEERSFSWIGRLEPGENLIPIAVRGQRAGRYSVLATAMVNGEKIEHRVELEVVGGV